VKRYRAIVRGNGVVVQTKSRLLFLWYDIAEFLNEYDARMFIASLVEKPSDEGRVLFDTADPGAYPKIVKPRQEQ
jgi:hypothetical protein